jgi:hypothetical protein
MEPPSSKRVRVEDLPHEAVGRRPPAAAAGGGDLVAPTRIAPAEHVEEIRASTWAEFAVKRAAAMGITVDGYLGRISRGEAGIEHEDAAEIRAAMDAAVALSRAAPSVPLTAAQAAARAGDRMQELGGGLPPQFLVDAIASGAHSPSATDRTAADAVAALTAGALADLARIRVATTEAGIVDAADVFAAMMTDMRAVCPPEVLSTPEEALRRFLDHAVREAQADGMIADALGWSLPRYRDGALTVTRVPDIEATLTLPEANAQCVQWHEAVPGAPACLMGSACYGMTTQMPAASLETPPATPVVLRAVRIGTRDFQFCFPCLTRSVETYSLILRQRAASPCFAINPFSVHADHDSPTAFPVRVCHALTAEGGWTGIAGMFPYFSLLRFVRGTRVETVRLEGGKMEELRLVTFTIQPALDF